MEAPVITPDILAEMLTDPIKAQDRLREIIAQRAASDEQFAALAQFVLEPAEAVRDIPPTPTEPRRADISRIRARIGDMRDELIAQTQRNQMLASALGSCGSCWGADSNCDDCQGGGTAGWRSPDITLFQDLIAPAFARLAADTTSQQPQEGN